MKKAENELNMHRFVEEALLPAGVFFRLMVMSCSPSHARSPTGSNINIIIINLIK